MFNKMMFSKNCFFLTNNIKNEKFFYHALNKNWYHKNTKFWGEELKLNKNWTTSHKKKLRISIALEKNAPFESN